MFRIFRIMTGKRGIYGKTIGKSNKYTNGAYINEAAVIGKYNYFGPYSMINNAVVGNYCSIGPGVKIGQGKHSLEYITTYQRVSSEITGHSLIQEPSIIGNDVWLGANVVVMQGVKIGNGAVIGANAVVTRDIPDYGIAVGLPAKVMKYRFNENTIRKINESNWYTYDIIKAKEIVKRLGEELISNN